MLFAVSLMRLESVPAAFSTVARAVGSFGFEASAENEL